MKTNRRAAAVLALFLVGGLATATAQAQCVVAGTATNCLNTGSVTILTPNPPTVALGAEVAVSADPVLTAGQVIVTTTYTEEGSPGGGDTPLPLWANAVIGLLLVGTGMLLLRRRRSPGTSLWLSLFGSIVTASLLMPGQARAGTSCPDTYTTNTVNPTILSTTWSVSGPGTYTASGTGTNAVFTPTSAGTGTVTYTTTWRTACGTETNVITAEVQFNVVAPPAITTEPANLTVAQGNSAVLSVTVTGTSPLTYQWQFDGTNIPNNIINTVAGNGTQGYSGNAGPATNAMMNGPYGVAMDATGNLYIADFDNNVVRKVTTNGIITTVAGDGTQGFSGNGGAATNASLNNPYGVAVDAIGNLYIADPGNDVIRMVATNGIISTVAGNGITGYTGDGGQATNARLNFPFGVAVDAIGNLFIADSDNDVVRKVTTAGIISTVAGVGSYGYSGNGGPATSAKLSEPLGVAVDALGNLFIADYNNDVIRKVNTNGIISTVAGNGTAGYTGDGGPATNVELDFHFGVAVDPTGNLFISDSGNDVVRKVATNGIITTLAGDGIAGYSGDGGASTNAKLNYPLGVAVDANGNLVISDSHNEVIREVDSAGQPTLTLNDPGATNAGSYSVTVTDLAGSVTSSNAVVTVISNDIAFTLSATNQFFNNPNVPLQISVTAGVPFYMAELVDSTNFASATWIPYNESPTVYVGGTQGWHQIWIGLRGLGANQPSTWMSCDVNLQTATPWLVITNPTTFTASIPMLEVQGYCADPLVSINYTLRNAAGVFPNQPAFVVSQQINTNTMDFTNTAFQAFDVPLANGNNTLTFYATDRAGNMMVTNYTYSFNYASMTNPPVMQLLWPQTGDTVTGTSFTVRGSLDDFTASVTLEITNTTATNTVAGIVERNGNFWIENVPLLSGQNWLSLTAMDAASNTTTTNITVTYASGAITIDDFTSQLGQDPYTILPLVTGTINLSGYTLLVNGIPATQSGGTWQAINVAVGPGGTAVVEADAIASAGGQTAQGQTQSNPNGSQGITTELEIDQPALLYIQQYEFNASYDYHQTSTGNCGGCVGDEEAGSRNGNVLASYGQGGAAGYSDTDSGTECSSPFSSWENWSWTWYSDAGPATEIYSSDSTTNASLDSPSDAIVGSQINFGALPSDLILDGTTPSQWKFSGSGSSTTDCGTTTTRDNYNVVTHDTLQTGGKATPQQKPIIQLFVSSTCFPSPIYEGPTLISFTSQGVPPQQISVPGSAVSSILGQYAQFFISAPSGAAIDVTPQVPSPRHMDTIQPPSPVTVTLTANSYDLSQTNPTFCVGQPITFAVTASGLPMTNVVCNWRLGGSVVNTPSTTCPGTYVYNPGANGTNPTNQCWYYNGPIGTVSVGLNILIGSKSISTAAAGQFKIVAPTVTNFLQAPGGAVSMFFQTNTVDVACSFRSYVAPLTGFSGTATYAQLINYSVNYYTVGGFHFTTPNTGGAYWLDNNYPYGKDTPATIPLPAAHNDSPQLSAGFPFANSISWNEQFKTYLLFQPTGGIT